MTYAEIKIETGAPAHPTMADKLNKALIAMNGAGIHRAGRWLVRGIDLSVRPGEIVTLIGPNGSGKSTTAKIAIGLLEPDEGTVNRSAKATIGYVPQSLSVDQTLPLTVKRLMTLAAPQDRAAVASALGTVDIAHLAEAQVQHLSGGEFQRALLARAMINKPDLLVLDEPVQGVDFGGELALYDLIKKVRDDTGCGVLMISHDLHVVMAETDTVICLNGHICCTGSPETVASNPEYARLFGQRAVEALAIYRHHHDHTHLPDGRVRHADGSITDHCHPGDGHHHETAQPPAKVVEHEHAR